MLAPASIEMERTLLGPRIETALAYASANRVNVIERFGADAWIGVVAAARRYHDLRQAFAAWGSTTRARRAGVRLLHARDALAARPGDRPGVRGRPRRDRRASRRSALPRAPAQGRSSTASRARRGSSASSTSRGANLLPPEGELDADAIARALVARLLAWLGSRLSSDGCASSPSPPHARIRCRWPPARRSSARGARTTARRPTPDGTRRRRRDRLPHDGPAEPRGTAATSPGSRRWAARARSGSAWRRSPTTAHIFQNLGDGTYFHSGSLAIRAAIAAGVNITYKLLYNDAVAMTGGQAVDGPIVGPASSRAGSSRGRESGSSSRPRTRAATRRVSLAPGAEVRDRSELIEAQEELAERAGRHGAHPRPGMRRGEAPPAQARQARRARAAGPSSTSACARAAATAGVKSNCMRVAAGRDRVRAQDADRPVVVQQGLLVPRRATARRSSTVSRARSASAAGRAADGPLALAELRDPPRLVRRASHFG